CRRTSIASRSFTSASSASCARTCATSSATTTTRSARSRARASSSSWRASICTPWTRAIGRASSRTRPAWGSATSPSAAPRSAPSISTSPTTGSSPLRYGRRFRSNPSSGLCVSSEVRRSRRRDRAPVKIHEYQAKALLREFGVAVPAGDVATTPAEARAVATRLGGKVVVKAQVHAGGRGKAGGIKPADDPEAAQLAARQILGMKLKSPQTPPDGILVRSVLVEEASAVDRELYLSITLDRARATHVVLASQSGGMDIEEVAARTPERIFREWTHPALGVQDFQARRLAYGLGLAGDQFKQAVAMIRSLFGLYLARDCSLGEVNPLVVTTDGP